MTTTFEEDHNQQKGDPTAFSEAWGKRFVDTDGALERADELIKEGQQKKDEVMEAQGELVRSFIEFLRDGKKEVLNRTLSSAYFFERNGNRREAVIAHDLLARIADSYGDYGNGMEHILKGLDIIEDLEDQELKGDLLATKGNLLNRTGDHFQAGEELQKALEIRKRIGNDRAIASNLNLLGRTFALDGEYEKALRSYRKSEQLREAIGDKNGLPWTYLGMATVHEKKGDPTKALEIFDKALKVGGETIRPLQLLVKAGKGRCYLALDRPEQAVHVLEEALEEARTVDNDPIHAEVLEAMYKAEKDRGYHNKALTYLEKYNALRETILERSGKDRLKHQEQAFQAEKKEKEAEIERLRNVELKKAYDELEEKNNEIVDSLNYASRIQSGSLPDEASLKKVFPEHFVLFMPRDIVSGDFYWCARTIGSNGHEKEFLVAADCTGHGVPGAFMSMLGISFFNDLILEKGYEDPGTILNELRDMVIRTLNPEGGDKEGVRKDGMDLTLIVRDPNVNRLEFAGANNPLYLVRSGQEDPPEQYDRVHEGRAYRLFEMKTERSSVGASEEMVPFSTRSVELKEGDKAYLLSDGFPDQFGGEKGKKFKYRPLKEILVEVAEKPFKEQHSELSKIFHDWKGAFEQVDDIVIVGVGL